MFSTAIRMFFKNLKSGNLQYNTLGQWDDRLIDQASEVASIIFCHNFLQNSLQKSFQFIFIFLMILHKIKSFEFPKSIRNYGKKLCLEHQTLGWSVVCPINPAYYIEDCRILRAYCLIIYILCLLDGLPVLPILCDQRIQIPNTAFVFFEILRSNLSGFRVSVSANVKYTSNTYLMLSLKIN